MVAENITLLSTESNISRADTACPGDTISYSCFALSNASELTWTVTLRGRDPVTVTYNATSSLRISMALIMGIETTLTRYVGVLIESTLLLTFNRYTDFYGTTIQCDSGTLSSDVIEVSANLSGR